MEWGFALAIVGIIVILLSTIWYFASYLNQLHTIEATGTQQVTGATTGTTGETITLKQAFTLTSFPTWAAIGWVAGALMVIGGTIWGVVARSKNKPDSNTAKLVNAFLSQQQQPAVVAPATSPVLPTSPSTPPSRPIASPQPARLTQSDAELLAAIKRLMATPTAS